MDSKEISSLLSALEDLLEIKSIIRKITPKYNLDDELYDTFIKTLGSLKDKLEPIFSKYVITQKSKAESFNKESFKNEIIQLAEKNNFLLLSSNSAKKKLKNLGIDARNIFVSGGPLEPEDYKKVNPNLPEKALKGIKQKCTRLLNSIKTKNWSKSELYFIYEKDNPTDKLILDKISIISDIIKKDVKTIEIPSWKILD
ncbi:MAG: DUF2100 domain-containing protein [Promethearchaeota archaeon]